MVVATEIIEASGVTGGAVMTTVETAGDAITAAAEKIVIIEVEIRTIKTEIGIVQSVIILIFLSEQSVIAVASKKEEAVLTSNAMTGVEETTGEIIIAVTIVILTAIMIGIVQNVKIPILHSEQNVIAAANLRAEVTQISNVTTAEEETIDAEVMRAEEETIDAEVMTDVEMVTLTEKMTGTVENVKILTFHSGMNVTDVAHLKEEGAHQLKNGKVMIVGREIEMNHLSLERVIGIVHNVVNPTLQNVMIALAVDAQKELAALEIKDTTANYATPRNCNLLSTVAVSGGITNEC